MVPESTASQTYADFQRKYLCLLSAESTYERAMSIKSLETEITTAINELNEKIHFSSSDIEASRTLYAMRKNLEQLAAKVTFISTKPRSVMQLSEDNLLREEQGLILSINAVDEAAEMARYMAGSLANQSQVLRGTNVTMADTFQYITKSDVIIEKIKRIKLRDRIVLGSAFILLFWITVHFTFYR